MIIEDRRTEEQKVELRWLVIGTDKILSGWGKAEGGVSYACWACHIDDLHIVLKWVESRTDMQRVRIAEAQSYRPSGVGHCAIYPVHSEHPARQVIGCK